MGFFLVTLPVLIASVVAAQTSGSFSLLSYNVAGLPGEQNTTLQTALGQLTKIAEIFSSGNPTVNTPLISPRLKPYNIINVQEDFNFHDVLYANDTHPFRTPTSGIAGTGSGLNTLSDFPYFDLDRVKWSSCNLNDGDCLTPKGFTFARIRVSDGFWFDLYNLHGDAGDEAGDIDARASNLAQLTAYAQTASVGMPIVVMGDTNTRYTRVGDSESLHSLINGLQVTDAWVSVVRDGSFPAEGADALVCDFPFPAGTTQAQMAACEVVDKIFARGSSTVSFELTAFTNENDAFVNSTGAPLSDHYPISSVISWTLSSSIRLADFLGGTGGHSYNDLTMFPSPPTLPGITSLTIRSASRVDALTYTAHHGDSVYVTLTHGGTGGSPATLTLGLGEYITEIQVCEGIHNGSARIFYASFTTNLGKTLSGGIVTSNCITTTAPADTVAGAYWSLVGFWGRSGDEVDRLGAIWAARSRY
ncbi:hypothetical protein C0995_008351 [Termitomyces sp. Mi166|nr:hypothetical protein C0995_008351 [Termitomyces sp. Mi166\